MDRLVVKIVGIGTGGCQAVNYVYNKGTSGVDFVFIDSSAFDYSNFACLCFGNWQKGGRSKAGRNQSRLIGGKCDLPHRWDGR